MAKRYVAIWFRHLLADWQVIRRPELAGIPFVFAAYVHQRMLITATSKLAGQQGIYCGMKAADAKAICPGLEVLDDKAGRANRLLKGIGEWCIRYSPTVSIDPFSPDGLLMEVSGCPHLWGGEREYLKDIAGRLKSKGYMVRIAIADTAGTAWAVSRYGNTSPVIAPGSHADALLSLPPAALRLDEGILAKLEKLGFYQIRSFISMPRSVLRRRFGEALLTRLGQALGTEEEFLELLQIPALFEQRLPCLEPIRTRAGIEVAIRRLLENLCRQLAETGQGIRTARLSCYRVDGKIIAVDIGTNAATNSTAHVFKLFELKIETIRPALGIELFTMVARQVDTVNPHQNALWSAKPGLNTQNIIHLLDRVAGKIGPEVIRRYLPAPSYWPERSQQKAISISDRPSMDWRTDKPRPTELLQKPEQIEVMALIPDHPPKLFVYQGKRHEIVKADGPERIEREWWMDEGEHRDYYQVEDDSGRRYWVYRSGHYNNEVTAKWYIHGFFA